MPGDVATAPVATTVARGGISFPSGNEACRDEVWDRFERPTRTIMSPSLYIRFLFPLVNFAFSFKTWLILFIRNVRVIICDIYVYIYICTFKHVIACTRINSYYAIQTYLEHVPHLRTRACTWLLELRRKSLDPASRYVDMHPCLRTFFLWPVQRLTCNSR